jgi:PAS domain S-box-containing protein
MTTPPFWQSGILGQSLVPLMGGTIMVIGMAIVGSYWLTTQDNRQVKLESLKQRAEERAKSEQVIIERVERQVQQCALLLLRRLQSHDAVHKPIPLQADGARRQLPLDHAPPLAGFVTSAAASDQRQVDAASCARDLLDELGSTLAEYPANLTIAVSGKWMATWGVEQVDMVAAMLPNDPVLLPAEKANVAHADQLSWSSAFVEPATDRWLVSASIARDYPGIGRIAISQLLPINEIMLRSVGKHLEGTKAVVYDQLGHALAVTGEQKRIFSASGHLRLKELQDHVFQRVQSIIPNTSDSASIIQDPISHGWLAVSRVAGPGWTMATYYLPDEIDAAARSTAVWILIVGIFVLGAQGILLLVVLRQRVSLPLMQLTKATSMVAADPNKVLTLDERRQDEIGELSRHFTTMAKAIASREADLRLSNETLREREELSRALIDSAADAVVLITDGIITEANPRAVDLFGAKERGLLGLSPTALINAEQQQGKDGLGLWNEYTTAAHAGHTQHLALSMCRRADGIFDAEIGLAKVNLPGATRLLAVIRDVTARNVMEQQMRQGQKLESLGQLAGGIAHDFNNMLAGIMGAAELLKYDPECSPDMQRHLRSILTTCDRAAGLTRKLLSFARKGQSQRLQVDIHQVIRDSALMLEHSLDKRIEIKLSLSATSWVVTGDVAQLQNAIINLAVNARDAMPNGGKIDIQTRLADINVEDEQRLVVPLKPGTYLELSLRDYGEGIPASVLSHIFEPFFTTKPIGKGTGLGLAAVYGMIVEHHGSVMVESEIGKGTTFLIYLPLSREGATSSFIDKGLLIKPNRGLVMIVDDEEMVRSVGRQLLEVLGCDVIEATDGKSAVDLFAIHHERIDVVILDMEMPGMRGIDCLRILREKRDVIPAILCSGYVRDVSPEQLRQEGFHAQLSKPYRIAELEQALDAAITKSKKST